MFVGVEVMISGLRWMVCLFFGMFAYERRVFGMMRMMSEVKWLGC